jgi:RES domain-containing protein
VTSLWRISEFRDLSGEGGRLGSARWHTRGRPVVYLAESPAGAMLERIVHLLDHDNGGILPSTFQLLRISVPDEATIKSLSPPARIGWKVHSEWTQPIGDAWLASLETPLARVPSVIVPYTWNYLLNLSHPAAGQVKIVDAGMEYFDNRLFGAGE